MKSLTWLAACALGLMLASHAASTGLQRRDNLPEIGEAAPELTGKGAEARLGDHAGKPLLLYFASSATRDSQLALRQLNSDLDRIGDLGETVLIVVLPGNDDAKVLKTELGTLPLVAHIDVSANRADMQNYGVIAYPTAFVLDAGHNILAVVRGYGTLSGFRIALALQLAAGKIDRAEYLRKTGSGGAEPAPKVDRYVRLAEKLISEDRTELALTSLAGHLDDKTSLRHIVLAARLAVALEDEARTATALTLLRARPDTEREVLLLEIEVKIRSGDLEQAGSSLDELTTANSPRTRFLQGLLAEARGDAAASAALFREAAATFATLDAIR